MGRPTRPFSPSEESVTSEEEETNPELVGLWPSSTIGAREEKPKGAPRRLPRFWSPEEEEEVEEVEEGPRLFRVSFSTSMSWRQGESWSGESREGEMGSVIRATRVAWNTPVKAELSSLSSPPGRRLLSSSSSATVEVHSVVATGR